MPNLTDATPYQPYTQTELDFRLGPDGEPHRWPEELAKTMTIGWDPEPEIGYLKARAWYVDPHTKRRIYEDEWEKEEKPNAGRNDPCPCGSGRKYKKCCL